MLDPEMSQLTFTYSKSAAKTEKDAKHVQS